MVRKCRVIMLGAHSLRINHSAIQSNGKEAFFNTFPMNGNDTFRVLPKKVQNIVRWSFWYGAKTVNLFDGVITVELHRGFEKDIFLKHILDLLE